VRRGADAVRYGLQGLIIIIIIMSILALRGDPPIKGQEKFPLLNHTPHSELHSEVPTALHCEFHQQVRKAGLQNILALRGDP
jgi:hypothetical protein